MSKDSKATLLVVDSDPNIRQLLTVLLSRRGYQILLAGTGEQALEHLRQDNIALILMDLELPDCKGIELLQSLKKNPTHKKIPVFMTTAKKDTQTIVNALEAGAIDYMIKPFDLLVLVARIQAQLRSLAPHTPLVITPLSLPAIESGKLLEGKYRLEEKIGEGGLSSVYRGVHLPLARKVAIKLLHPVAVMRETIQAQAQARFRVEAMISARLQHPNAVTIFDFGSSEGNPFLVMELLKGNNLADELAKKRRLSPKRCVELLLPICQALSYAHQLDIVHRDLKPENIFLHQTLYGEVPKLLDFGLAKTSEPTEVITTQPGYLWGTLSYLAPERILGQPYDNRADLYSLGITLYELLAGRLPFLSDSQAQEASMHVTEEPPPIKEQAIPPALEALMRQALNKLPGQRPSAAEFIGRLAALQQPLGISPSGGPIIGTAHLEHE